MSRQQAQPIQLPTHKDGSDRIMLFRTPPMKPSDGTGIPKKESTPSDGRTVLGCIGIWYDDQVPGTSEAIEFHALNIQGPGKYRVVVQKKIKGRWMYERSYEFIAE